MFKLGLPRAHTETHHVSRCVCVTYSPLKKVIVIFIHDYGASTLLQILHQFSHLSMASMSTED
jgi:hypothetical protein